MQNKTIKLIAIISLFIIICIFPIKVFSSWVDDAKGFLDAADDTAVVDQEQLHKTSNDVYNILTSIGMIVSVVVGIVLGIIYMMSSAIDKAKVKESLIPYLIGSLIIFGAFGIWKLIINTFSGL